MRRGTLGDNVMYFEAGQGSALSAGANLGVDQQTCEARAYAVARKFKPLIVNSVVGFRRPLAVSVTAGSGLLHERAARSRSLLINRKPPASPGRGKNLGSSGLERQNSLFRRVWADMHEVNGFFLYELGQIVLLTALPVDMDPSPPV